MTEKSKIANIIQELDSLNVGEIAELITNIKERYGIQETAIVQPSTGASESEKTAKKGGNVSVKLVKMEDVGLSPIKVYGLVKDTIKELKGESINVIQAKKLTEKEDKIILENIPRDKAEEFQKKVEKGAQVEIKEI